MAYSPALAIYSASFAGLVFLGGVILNTLNIWRGGTKLLLLTIILSGCSADHRQADIKKCISKAQSEVVRQDGQGLDEVHDIIGSFVVDCMNDSGYRHDMSGEKCIDDVDFIAACYVPKR